MSRLFKIIAILDTNVLYPIEIRDILFWFAHYELFQPRWTHNIFNEWKSVMQRKGIGDDEANKRIQKANRAFPNALVENHEILIPALSLPDPDDCHVLAAAIKSEAQIIVTNNIRDFTANILVEYSIKAQTPDDFLVGLIDLDTDTALQAFKSMVFNRKNPNLNENQVIRILKKQQLVHTADYLHRLI